jgi:hypothetical protein
MATAPILLPDLLWITDKRQLALAAPKPPLASKALTRVDLHDKISKASNLRGWSQSITYSLKYDKDGSILIL